jgi:hypothetical protein
MLGFELSRLMLRLLSMVLGGFGIFCLVMSFAMPGLAGKALLLLATATAIDYFSS